MFDDRRFSDTYDLYRPTTSVDSGGVETIADPGTATSTDNPCLYVPRPGRMGASARGPDIDYDATMLVPGDADLCPEQRGQQPDVVLIDSRYYVVLAVWDAAGAGQYQRVPLRERI